MLNKIDIKYIIFLIAVGLAAFVSYCFKEQILILLSNFFGWKHLNFVAGGFASVVTIVHKIKHRKLNFKKTMTFSEFNTPFSELFSFALNPVTLVCALSLAKALFLQFFNNFGFFNYFSAVELTFVGIVTSYLLYTSLIELFNDLSEIIIKSSIQYETPKPVNKDEAPVFKEETLKY